MEETIEEAAYQYAELYRCPATNENEYCKHDIISAFNKGAKWQIDKQDNFIIGFLEFIEGTYSYSNIFDYWYLHADTSKTYTKKELLKKYNDTLNGN
jgi:hypothetical protein